MESKTIFFTLASFLIFIVILSMLGILGPTDTTSTEKVVVTGGGAGRGRYFYPPVYGGRPYRKNVVYAPDVYMAPGPYDRRFMNRRFRGYW